MKNMAFSKSISSPGRIEKFPPPLMRFLRSNTSSSSSRSRSRRSRGRSHSTPMFLRKNNATNKTVIESTQEPSSPKVSCIGQVRVKRSSNSNNSSTSSKPRRKNSSRINLVKKKPCWSIRKALFSHHFCPKFDLFHSKKIDTRDDSSSKVGGVNVIRDNESSDHFTSISDDESREVLHSSKPPRNALLLTRCKSAPYSSSSLASRFWGSPTKGIEDIEEKSSDVVQELHKDIVKQDEAVESRLSEKSEEETEMESAVNERISREEIEVNSINQDLRCRVDGAAVHPLLLTRCKSEPARIGERLNPDSNFWKQRRFEVSDIIKPSSLHNRD